MEPESPLQSPEIASPVVAEPRHLEAWLEKNLFQVNEVVGRFYSFVNCIVDYLSHLLAVGQGLPLGSTGAYMSLTRSLFSVL